MSMCLFSSDYISGKIYQHDGFSSTITSSFAKANLRGMCFDGTDLYSVLAASNGKILKHSGFSATIKSSFSSPSTSPRGIAFDGTYLYSSDILTDKIYKHSGFNTRILDSFSSPSDNPMDMSIVFGNLLCADNKIYMHSGFTTTVQNSFAPGRTTYGIDFGQINLYSASSGDRIYQHSGFSATIIASFSSPSTGLFGISIGWIPSDEVNTVALTDGEFTEFEFTVDSYQERLISYDKYMRTQTGDLKFAEGIDKKLFSLGLNNISAENKDILKTLYDMRRQLYFYKNASDQTYTAIVIWKDNFNLHTPVNNSLPFINQLYSGSMQLEEV